MTPVSIIIRRSTIDMQRIKKVGLLSINDIWLDNKSFEKSNASICALHTNDLLPKQQYDFCLISKTFLLDISNVEQLFKGNKYGALRHGINKAIKDGIVVKHVESDEEINKYMQFQKEFCEKKEIPCLSEGELPYLECYYALSQDGEYLGACAFCLSEDGETIRYKYGATKHKMYANEIIFWEVIKEYSNKGYKYFDFGGVTPTEDKNSYYYRHYQFKKKFGGELIDQYTYFKIKGVYRIFYYLFSTIVKIFFKGDVNGFTNWLNRTKLLH